MAAGCETSLVSESGRRKQQELFDERVREQDATHPGYADAWSSFASSVLQHGGELVVPPISPDPMIDWFRGAGSAWSGEGAIEAPGATPDCHRNTVLVWRDGAAAAIGTGYALSEDGLWREHSWVWLSDGHLSETTAPRITYFGLRLEGDQADWFADWIVPDGAPLE